MTLFANVADDLRFPTLAELNEEMCNWGDNNLPVFREESEEFESFTSDKAEKPPPTVPPAPNVPSISKLAAALFNSDDKLFFISHRVPGCAQQEWSLVRVALDASLKLNNSCLQDGRFIVEFFVCHPGDKLYNASNQRYWLEYHPTWDGPGLDHKHTAHLLRPTASSPEYAISEGLTPFRQWVILTNSDCYICGPFNFAVINGRQSKDRISLEHWKILTLHKERFFNPVPSLETMGYSVHYSQPHEIFYDDAISARFDASPPVHAPAHVM